MKHAIASQYSHRIAHQIPYHTLECADLDEGFTNYTGNGSRIESTTESPRGLEHSLYGSSQGNEQAKEYTLKSISNKRDGSSPDATYIQRQMRRKIWARYLGRSK